MALKESLAKTHSTFEKLDKKIQKLINKNDLKKYGNPLMDSFL